MTCTACSTRGSTGGAHQPLGSQLPSGADYCIPCTPTGSCTVLGCMTLMGLHGDAVQPCQCLERCAERDQTCLTRDKICRAATYRSERLAACCGPRNSQALASTKVSSTSRSLAGRAASAPFGNQCLLLPAFSPPGAAADNGLRLLLSGSASSSCQADSASCRVPVTHNLAYYGSASTPCLSDTPGQCQGRPILGGLCSSLEVRDLHAASQGCEGAGNGLQRTLKQLQSAAGAASLLVGLAVAMADLVLQVEVRAEQHELYHKIME